MSKRASSARAVGPDAATAARQTAHAAAAVRVLVLLRVKIQHSFLPIPLLHGPTGVCGKGKSARQAPVLLRRRAARWSRLIDCSAFFIFGVCQRSLLTCLALA